MLKNYCNKELLVAACFLAGGFFMLTGFYSIPYVDHFMLNDIRYTPNTPGYEEAVLDSRRIFLAIACACFVVSIYSAKLGVKKIRQNYYVNKKIKKDNSMD